MYLGELQAPQDYQQAKAEIKQEDVDYFWAEIRNAFREIALEMMCEPRTVWEQVTVELKTKGVHSDEIEWLQEAIIGLRDPSLEECLRQRAKHPDMPLLSVLLAIKEKYGGNQDRLGKFETGCRALQVGSLTARYGCM